MYHLHKELLMKIGFKLIFIMIILNVAGIGILGSILLLNSRAEVTRMVKDDAVDTAMYNAQEIRAYLEIYLDMARNAAQILTQYKDIDLENRRPLISSILKGLAQENPEVFGVWCVWEPDVLEGGDTRYADTPGSNSDGRFVPYWYWDSGKLVLSLLTTFNTDDYYQAPLKSGNETILNPATYKLGGKDVLMTTLSAPIKVNGRVVGVAGVDLTLDSLQKKMIALNPGGNGLAAVFSNNGTISAHFDTNRLGKNMRETERDMAGKYLDDFVGAVAGGQIFSYSVYNADMNTNIYVFSVPIPLGKTTTPWAMAIGVLESVVMEPVRNMLYVSLIVAVSTIAVVIAAAVFFSRSISKPIIKTADILKDISEGEGDLTKTIPVKGNDEIAALSQYFNQTLEKIRGLVAVIKQQATVLFDIGTELASNMTESAAAVNEITANIQNIKSRVINQSASVTETNATMEQITVNIDKLNEHVEKQTSSVSQSSSAIEEMLANIQSVTQTLIKNGENVKELTESSEVGRTGLQDVAADIQEISRESEGLLEINAVMENIASQTNLLSMNAAIEAAHAGEAGKGFAVVADEIRKLAESSSEQSKTISTVLKKIKESIDKITRSTDNVLNKFEAIDLGIKTVADQEANIRNAMEEQGEGSKQVLEAIASLNEITQQVKGGSVEMLEGSKEVIQESKNLEMATQEITGGMNEMASGAEQVNVAINRVNELTGDNRENIDKLVREVSRFKIE
jgi:methyl-accepting chemotaxis protein